MRRAFYVVAMMLALAAGAPQAATAAMPAQAEQVHVDGVSVTVDCTGAGAPTVILFAGFGDSHTVWADIQDSLSTHTRVCSYDRLGEGSSSAPPRNIQTLASNARLLHDVLDTLQVGGPLVLVGHSAGGDIAANYARTYPASTAGVVLFDATPVGYLQYVLSLIPGNADGLPQALREEAISVVSGRNQERLKVTGNGWAPPGSLGHIPLAVVEHGVDIFAAAGKYDQPLQDRWAQGQLDFAKLSSASQVIVAPTSGHYIYLDQPQLALDVIDGVIAES
jgi:pimeloyl-ACP methyl ester carboxylesterase